MDEVSDAESRRLNAAAGSVVTEEVKLSRYFEMRLVLLCLAM